MKNLINRVLGVLVVSAIFAGSVDAAQRQSRKGRMAKNEAPAAKAVDMSMEAVFHRIGFSSTRSFKRYSKEQRNADIAVLRQELPSTAKGAIDALSKAILLENDADRKKSLEKGDGAKAYATVKVCIATADLQDANTALAENKTPENVANVAVKKAAAEAAVAEGDEVAAGWKSYLPSQSTAYKAIGVASVVITGYCITYGAPAWLAPYVPTVMTTMANKIYAGVSTAGKTLGLQEGGRVYELGKTLYGYGPAQLAAMAATGYGYYEAGKKRLFGPAEEPKVEGEQPAGQ